MFGSDCDGADSHCVRCGAPIYFEIGPGTSRCPACGENPDYTDAQLAERARREKDAARDAGEQLRFRREACEVLQRLKAGRTRREIEILDHAMDCVCMFESENVRLGKPPLHDF